MGQHFDAEPRAWRHDRHRGLWLGGRRDRAGPALVDGASGRHDCGRCGRTAALRLAGPVDLRQGEFRSADHHPHHGVQHHRGRSHQQPDRRKDPATTVSGRGSVRPRRAVHRAPDPAGRLLQRAHGAAAATRRAQDQSRPTYPGRLAGHHRRSAERRAGAGGDFSGDGSRRDHLGRLRRAADKLDDRLSRCRVRSAAQGADRLSWAGSAAFPVRWPRHSRSLVWKPPCSTRSV